MNLDNEPLTLRLCLQWLLLNRLKQQPMTADECLEQLHQVLDPPPQPGKPNRKYSADKVRLTLKGLTEEGYILEVFEQRQASYSISKKGYTFGSNLRPDLHLRVHDISQSLKRMIDLVEGTDLPSTNKTVLSNDRPFLRSLVSVNDIVRVFILQTLSKSPKMTIPELHKEMLSHYSWACSEPYMKILCRNYLTEGVNEFDEPVTDQPVLLKSEYQGNLGRRRLRVFSIKDETLAAEWLSLYSQNAITTLKDAYRYTEELLRLLSIEGRS